MGTWDTGPGTFREALAGAARRYYDEPFRRYHGFSHPTEMLAAADAAGLRLSRAQEAAIALHDAVNAAGVPPGVNEAASAGVLRAWAPVLGMSREEADEASAITLATDHAGGPAPASADVVLDLDLMRLASPPEAFEALSDDVWHEWAHLVPDRGRFMRLRAGFFADFLRRPRIYRTGLFDEGVARATLSGFVERWSRGPA
jgi:predicted metal-dependent HD superfamily phosphohydrolase